MPTIPTIKTLFSSMFNSEYPPPYVTVSLEGKIVSFTKDRLYEIDKSFYLIKTDGEDGIPIIGKKLQ